jgi:hypothetical protein
MSPVQSAIHRSVLLVILVVVSLAAVSCDPRDNPSNPFGVSIDQRLSFETRMRAARSLGVRYYRATVSIVRGTPVPQRANDPAAIAGRGFRLALNVRAYDDGSAPEDPPMSLAEWRVGVASTLDRYHPALLVVSNEENIADQFTGTPEQYEAMLRVACEEAHRRQTPCANGGMLSGSVVLYVYQRYRDQGDTAKAASFRSRAFEDWQKRLTAQQIEVRARRAGTFVEAYRRAAPDYANIHWYVDDTLALRQAVETFRAVIRRPVISNEMGQRNNDPAITRARLETATELGLTFVVWYSSDAGPASPRSLVRSDGSLRPTGQAFRDFVQERYGASPAGS